MVRPPGHHRADETCTCLDHSPSPLAGGPSQLAGVESRLKITAKRTFSFHCLFRRQGSLIGEAVRGQRARRHAARTAVAYQPSEHSFSQGVAVVGEQFLEPGAGNGPVAAAAGFRRAGLLVRISSLPTCSTPSRSSPTTSGTPSSECRPRSAGNGLMTSARSTCSMNTGRRHAGEGSVELTALSRERIDVLPGRGADALETWLRTHPRVEIVCRDGSGAYAEAIRRALPDAVQVSDRWHLRKNLCDKTLAEIRSHSDCWASVNLARPAGVREQTTRERWQQIHDLLDKGVGLLECARRLDLSLNTVKRWKGAARDGVDLLVHRVCRLARRRPVVRVRGRSGPAGPAWFDQLPGSFPSGQPLPVQHMLDLRRTSHSSSPRVTWVSTTIPSPSIDIPA